MKKRYKVIIGAVLVVVLAAYGGYSYLSPLGVKVDAVTKGDISDNFTLQGQIVPMQAILLNSAATGIITNLPFKPGTTVQKGQELVSITPAAQTELSVQKEQLRQQLATAEYQYAQLFGSQGQARQQAAVEAAQSAYELAERQYQAALEVEENMGGVYTEAELATLATAVKAARQNLVSAQTQGAASADRVYYQTLMESTRAQLTALEEEQNQALTAPFDGVIWYLQAEEGQFIIKNQPLLKMYQPQEMKIEVSLLSEDSLGLQVNDEVNISIGGGQYYPAKVIFISPVAQQVISTLGIMENRCTVELFAENLPAGLGAGYQVDAHFSRLLAQNVLSVAASSIVPLDEGSAVYVAQNGKARLIPITTGVKSGGRVEVISGLSAGDMIIANPYDAGIKDGLRVQAISE